LTRSKGKKQRRPSRDKASGLRQSQGGARRFRLLAIIGAVVVCGLLAAFLTMTALDSGSSGPSVLKAAIVDQLSFREPNPAFVQGATATLEEAGYVVDYYPGDQITVDFYRDLPTHGYKLIVVRGHSAVPRTDLALPADVPQDLLQRVLDTVGDDVLLFTSEPYSDTSYLDEQRAMRLFPVVYAGEQSSDSYFAITAGFITSSMKGKFDGTTVILMGCSGLASDNTAAAFVKKGAKTVVGWSSTVSSEHTDAATERLLQHLTTDKLDAQEAVSRTAAEVGADPQYGSTLLVYPPSHAASAPH
jgi:hypothetical protein